MELGKILVNIMVGLLISHLYLEQKRWTCNYHEHKQGVLVNIMSISPPLGFLRAWLHSSRRDFSHIIPYLSLPP